MAPNGPVMSSAVFTPLEGCTKLTVVNHHSVHSVCHGMRKSVGSC